MKANFAKIGRFLRLGMVISTLAMSASFAHAQSVDFQVDNFSLEQVIASSAQSAGPDPAAPGSDLADGSSTFVAQFGEGNEAATAISASPGAASALVQYGNGNTNYAVIDNSPGSTIAGLQLGNDNSAVAAIIGGSGNSLATAQIGSGLGLAVGLVDSVDTTVIYGQAGDSYTGGVVIRNAPAGTTVRFN